jgi:antitoxin component YwqK of YwqJK toxin-antitoxin module
MINHITPMLLFISIGFSQKEYDIKNLIKQEYLYIGNFNDNSLNGIVYKILGDQKVILGKLKNGKKDGLWIEWYPDRRKLEETYNEGLLDGFMSLFYNNGQKEWRHTYNNGMLEGLWTYWYKNGQKSKEGNFEGGDSTGIWIWWDKNGQIKKEKKFKNRKKGIWSDYNEYVFVEVVK